MQIVYCSNNKGPTVILYTGNIELATTIESADEQHQQK